MSRYDDDEFKKVKKGLPEENTQQKASINYLLIFTIVGAVLASVILIYQDTISVLGNRLGQSGNNIPEQIIINGILAFLIGSVQAWIFKERIKSRTHIFIAFSIVGGAIAGVVGGLFINAGLHLPVAIGMINGAFAGGISSGGQNMVMQNLKHKSRWLFFSIASWAAIFSIGWIIGWKPESEIDLALAAFFLLSASGISLAIFLNNTPQIEFS